MAEFITKEAITREDIDAIVDVTWAAHYDPYRPMISATFPIFGPTKRDRELAVQESKDRFWKAHSANPDSHWIMVIEEHTRTVVGAAQWLVHLKNPFPDGTPKIIATWWPEETVGREFVSSMFQQTYAPRHMWCRRPCVILNAMSTHPLFRRRGVGSLMMEFGERKAVEHGLESWLEAGTESGRFLYEKFGYKVILKFTLSYTKAGECDEWRKLAHDLKPWPLYAMWKPVGGTFSNETVMPWDLGPATV